MPPVNITSGTAIAIASLPYSTTQDVNDGGTTYEVWYKYTPSSSRMISVWGLGDLVTYKPRMTVYKDEVLGNHAVALNVPGQVYCDSGHTYYFRFVSSTGNVTPAILTLSVIAFTPDAMPAGSIVVNDDRYDAVVPIPAAVLATGAGSPSGSPESGELLGFLRNVVAGEMGDVVADGTFVFENISGQASDIVRVTVYSPQFDEVATVTPTHPSASWEQAYVGSDGNETFYIGFGGDDPTYQTLSKTGVTGTPVDLDGVDLAGLAASPDGTILYYTSLDTFPGGTWRVKRWDLGTDTPLSDLTSPVANFLAKDIVVMADGTVVVLYERTPTSNNEWQARSYDDTGTLLQTFDFTAEDYSTVRIARGQFDDSFWMWLKRPAAHGDKGESYFYEYDPVTGSELNFLQNWEFSHGTYSGAATLDPPRFGVSESCPLIVTRAAISVIPTIPEPGSLIDESEPCPCPCTCDGETKGVTGPVIPPTDFDWTRECEGGGTVPSAAEIVESEDWMVVPKEPDTWLTIETDPYPGGSPLEDELIHVGRKPLSDRGRYVEGRLIDIGTIERGSSDKDGRYPPARARFMWADDDARLRILLAGTETRHLFQRFASYYLLSYAGRKANLTPIPLMRGRIVNVQPEVGRQAMVEVQDLIGSNSGPLNPDKKIGLLIGDEHPNLPDETIGRIYPICYGEHSDHGAVDANGDSAEKGIWPAIDCGDTDFESETLPEKVSAPQNLTANYVGTETGDNTYYYAIVGLTNFGQTAKSNIVSVSDLPDSLDKDNYVELNWDPPVTGAEFIIAYWVLGRTSSNPNKRLDTMNGNNFENPPETTYNDGRQGTSTDFDHEKAVNLQPIPTAYASNSLWTWFVVAIGEVEILAVYGSDIANGVPPKRVLLDINNGDILTPDSDDWPEPEPYRVVGGIRQTGFWARGTRVDHHRQGVVTFAVNVCGYKGLNGLLIDQAYRMLLSFLNNFVEQDYRDGDFNSAIVTYPDGTPKFWTSKYEEAQEATKTLMGSPDGLGFVGAIGITEPTALSTVLQRFVVTFGGHLSADGWGRFYPYVITSAGSPSEGLLFKERQRIAEVLEHRLAFEEIENRGEYAYHRDYDAQAFRHEHNTFEDAESIAAHGGEPIGVFQGALKECWYGNDAATMSARWAQELELYAYPPRYVTWTTNLEPRAIVNGDPVRFSHRKEGLGSVGEAETPGVVMQVDVLSQPHALRHTVRLLDVITASEENVVAEGQLVADGSGDPLVSEDGLYVLLADGE